MKSISKSTMLAVLGGLLVTVAPLGAGVPPLAMLDQLEPGVWEFHERSAGNSERLCVRQGRALVQLRHPGPACQTYIVTDKRDEVAVQYSCSGRGYGQTHIRRETNRLVQIDGSGLAEGLPFEFSFEARRVASC